MVRSIAILPDGRIRAAGDFLSLAAGGLTSSGITRVTQTGGVEFLFGSVFRPGESGSAVAVQADGRVLAAHGAAPRLARLLADGSLDGTFDVGTGPNDWTDVIVLQSDGKVVIAGSFTSYNGTAVNRIARLNSNGDLDNSFDVGTGADDWVGSVALQPDGKVLIGGDFTSINGTNRNYLARLNANGSLDAGFDIGTGPDCYVRSVLLQSDAKLMIAGYFGSFNGTARRGVARLNPNGSLDETFDPGTGPNFDVEVAALQPDGKVLIGGVFTTVNGIVRNNLARLNADGGLDADFDPRSGLGSADLGIQSMAVQPDQKVVVGGWHGLSRLLLADPPRLTGFKLQPLGTAQISGIGPTNAHLRLYHSTNLPNWFALVDGTNAAGAFEFMDPNAGAVARNFYRVLWMP